MAISSVLGSSALLPAGLGFRNLIINGAMNVDQRNTATTAVTTNAYALDRWYSEDGSTAVVSVQQSTDVPSGQGFVNSLKATATTADTSVGAAEFSVITQHIEGSNSAQLAWGATGAKPVVVSFWVKATVTGTYSFTLYNSDSSRICPSAYTVNASNTWEKKTIYIVGDSSGTWLTTTARGISCNFYTILGSNYLGTSGVWNSSSIYGVTGQANAYATVGNIFAVTGVQFEQNLQPTPFESRPIDIETMLCHRYHQRIIDPAGVGVTQGTGGGSARVTISLNTKMRAAPSSFLTGTVNFYNGTTVVTSTAIAVSYNSPLHAQLDFAASFAIASQAVVMYTTGGSQYIDFNAEL